MLLVIWIRRRWDQPTNYVVKDRPRYGRQIPDAAEETFVACDDIGDDCRGGRGAEQGADTLTWQASDDEGQAPEEDNCGRQAEATAQIRTGRWR